MRFYNLVDATHPWGDYFSILAHGVVKEKSATDRQWLLDRVGPFVPDITLGRCRVIVTTRVRRAMESAALSGIRFRPIRLGKIVALDWQSWDQYAREPQIYPRGGEPLNYIASRRHSTAVAKQMPALWELVPRKGGDTIVPKDFPFGREPVRFVADTWDHSEVFYVGRGPLMVFTPAARKCLSPFFGRTATMKVMPIR